MLFLQPLIYEQYRGIIHINTTVSNGLYSIEDIARLAQEKDISVVIYTDHFFERFSYGLPHFRKLIRKTVKRNCIAYYGIKKYLTEIKRVNKLFPDMVLIPGCKVRPFYYWTGSYFKKPLTLHDSHKRLLIIGLDNSEDYKNLPLIGNGKSNFSEYQGNQGAEPYQSVIDYVNYRDGLSFWSLPEATTNEKIGGITVITEPYPTALSQTKAYTGFGSIYEGYRKVGGPGGVWDKVLCEYCEGKRNTPIWTIGELDYHYESGDGGKTLDAVQTVFLVPVGTKPTSDYILNALRKGKMYTLWKTKEYTLILDDFSIQNESNYIAYMGDKIVCRNISMVKIKVHCSDFISRDITIKLIRSGKIIKNFCLHTPVDTIYKDTLYNHSKIYYRLDIETKYPHKVLTNPIFVESCNDLYEAPTKK